MRTKKRYTRFTILHVDENWVASNLMHNKSINVIAAKARCLGSEALGMDAKVFMFEDVPAMLGVPDSEAAASHEQNRIERSGQELAGLGVDQLVEFKGRHMKISGIVQTSAYELKHRTFTPIWRSRFYYLLPTT